MGALLHGLRPVDEECRAKVAAEKSGNVSLKLKDDDGTHLEQCTMAKIRQQACHSRPARAFLFPNLTHRARSGLTAYKTMSTDGWQDRPH